MNALDKKLNLGFRGWTWAAASASIVLLAWIVFLGSQVRSDPHRCGSFFQPIGGRCCAPGQALSAGHCVGTPDSCEDPFLLVTGSRPGCILPPRRIRVPAGSVTLGPTDWDSVNVVERHTVTVRSFLIDESEVTRHEFQACISQGRCEPLPAKGEPGLPMTDLSVEAAQGFCAHRGGRLPTPAEWVFAATGPEARRFPWGPHGLVCRRASFGLALGPCSSEGLSPELAGLRPSGATPSGILDLSGNVAEWAQTESGRASLHGGSFRSKTAGELKAWSTRPPSAADDVGFRCVYPPSL